MHVSFLLSRKRTHHMSLVTVTVIFAWLFLGSCDSKEKSDIIFIKGKVVNPKHGTVVFTDYEKINDTVQLSPTNEFTLSLKNVEKPGLYTFWHANEYQSVYLEPGDSITLFVDTKSFDESLSFSNDRAKENNYLINMFVEMEIANKSFLPHYKKEPNIFLNHLEKRVKNQLYKLERDAKREGFNASFVAIGKDIIKFNNLSKKERYVAAHYGSAVAPCNAKLPNTFYDHRKTLNINDIKLLNNNSFKSFLNSFIANKTRERLANYENDATDVVYATTRLHATIALLENETMRELYLSNYTRNVLRNAKDHEMPQAVLDTYLELSKSEINKSNMLALANSFKTTRKGNDFADLLLNTASSKKVMLGDVVKKQSIIYYWSAKEESYSAQVHLTVADLRKKYPEFEFIGINTDEGADDKWKHILHTMAMDTTHEYKVAQENSFNLSDIIRGSKRAMLIDKDLTIIDGNLNLLHYKIETTLLGYASK